MNILIANLDLSFMKITTKKVLKLKSPIENLCTPYYFGNCGNYFVICQFNKRLNQSYSDSDEKLEYNEMVILSSQNQINRYELSYICPSTYDKVIHFQCDIAGNYMLLIEGGDRGIKLIKLISKDLIYLKMAHHVLNDDQLMYSFGQQILSLL